MGSNVNTRLRFHGSCARGVMRPPTPSTRALLLAFSTLVTAMAVRLPLCGQHQFLSNGLCQPCRQCPPGEEPNQVCGNDYGEGTTCEACPAGYFSDRFGYDQCQPRIDCDVYNAKTQTAGDQQHDSVCGDCRSGFYHCSLLPPDSNNKYDKYECCDCRRAKTTYPECRAGHTTASIRMPDAVPTVPHNKHVAPLLYVLLGTLLLLVILGVWAVRGPLRRPTLHFLKPLTRCCQHLLSRRLSMSGPPTTLNLLHAERPPHHRRHSCGGRFSDTLKNCNCEHCQCLLSSFEAVEFQKTPNSPFSPFVPSKKTNGNTSGPKPAKVPKTVKEDSDSDDYGPNDSGPVPWLKTVQCEEPPSVIQRRPSIGLSFHPTVPIEPKPEEPTRIRIIKRVEEMYKQALKITKDMTVDSLDFRLREKLALKLNSSLNVNTHLLSRLGHRLGITRDDAVLLTNAEDLLRVAGTRAASVPSLLEALHDVEHYDVLRLLCEGLLLTDNVYNRSSV